MTIVCIAIILLDRYLDYINIVLLFLYIFIYTYLICTKKMMIDVINITYKVSLNLLKRIIWLYLK